MLEKFAAQSLVEHNGELIFSKEKFAELIVRECVSALQTKIDDGDGYGSYEAGVHRGFIGARNIIKKHFGVKE